MKTTQLLAGTLLADKLRVVKLLGEGGMGSVYEVEHQRTRKRCALKILRSEMCRSRRMLARFWREVSVDGRICNPHIIEVHDAGVLADGEPYFVMELLSGETLAERIARRPPLVLEELCDLVGQVCEGVQAAHEAKIIHRDLKPQNLFLTTREGRPFVKVLDFGVSKLANDDETAITHPGTTLGTPAYMAPEQLLGTEAVDPRSDIYSLGVILYECATGRKPFHAGSVDLLGVLVREGKPENVGVWRPDLPRTFCALVARAMAVEKADRFASARELGQALREVRDAARDTLADHTRSDGEIIASFAGTDLLNSTVLLEPSCSQTPSRSWLERSAMQKIAPIARQGSSPRRGEKTKHRLITITLLGLAAALLAYAARPSLSVRAQPPSGPSIPPVDTVAPSPEIPPISAAPPKPAPPPVAPEPERPRRPPPRPPRCTPEQSDDCPLPDPIRERS